MLDQGFLSVPFAHRALHDLSRGRPENSRAAIRAAIDAGYGIEIDLQLSADGQAMVFHDYDLARLTAAGGPIRMRRAEALARIPLSGGTEGIPDFHDILGIVDGRVPLLVELKDQDGAMGAGIGALEAAAAAAVRDYRGAVAFMSFNPHSVACLAKLAPEVPRGLVTDGFARADWPLLADQTRNHLAGIPDYARVGASFISHCVSDLHRPRVAELKTGGASVLCWTVRSAAQEAEARRIADNVTFEGYLAAIAT